MRKMIQKLALILFAFVTFGGLLYLPEYVFAKPPPWAPAHGYRAKQRYYYYPAAQVYYSPVQRGYFFLDAGTWRFGVSLPTGIVLGNRVSVDLDGPQPYVYHPQVIQVYPVR